MTVLTTIPNGASYKDIRDTLNSVLAHLMTVDERFVAMGDLIEGLDGRLHTLETAGPAPSPTPNPGPTPTPTPTPEPTPGTQPTTRGQTVLAGQSLANRSFAKNDDTTTIAAAGALVSPNSRIMATFSEAGASQFMPAIADLAWGVASDAGPYTSAFAAAYPYYMEKQTGRPWDLVGHAVGNTPISSWQPGQPNHTQLMAVIAKAGGAFEEFVWIQGHRDATDGTTYAQYMSMLTTLMNSVKAASSVVPRIRIMSIPWLNGTLGGTAAQLRTIRKAAADWCAANGATYVTAPDINLTDGVHPGQIGMVAIARHFARAARLALGLIGSDAGPSIASVSRDSVSGRIVMAFNMPAGAAPLVKTGDPSPRIQVYQAGTFTKAFDVSGLIVGSNTVTFLDQSPTTRIDVMIDSNPTSGPSDGTTAIIRDSHIESGEAAAGMTVGRTIAPTLTPFTVEASAGDPGYRFYRVTPTKNADNYVPSDGSYIIASPEVTLLNKGAPLDKTGWTATSSDGATYGTFVPARLVDGSLTSDFKINAGQGKNGQFVIDAKAIVVADAMRIYISATNFGYTMTRGTVEGSKDGETWTPIADFTSTAPPYEPNNGGYITLALAA